MTRPVVHQPPRWSQAVVRLSVVAVLTAWAAGSGALHASAGVAGPRTAPCNQSALQTSINAGGIYVFASSCSLKLTKTLKVPAHHNVALEANGHAVTINGESPSFPPDFGFVPAFVVSGSLALDGLTVAHGSALGAKGGPARGGGVRVGKGGALTTNNVVFTADEAVGGAGADREQGQSGATGAPGGTGGAGDTGAKGGGGGDGAGGGVYVASGASATLMHTTFSDDLASGGAGGAGSTGGSGGQGGESPSGSAAGSGGKGAKGSDGGDAGTGKGGAVFSEGKLTIVGGAFDSNNAVGGTGGTGGGGGAGGAGGHLVVGGGGFGNGGDGADGGDAGDGGEGQGGAVYAAGTTGIKAALFTKNEAIGGSGGDGGAGGPGGSGFCPSGNPSDCGGNTGGDGGDGGDGGKAANGQGGAIEAHGSHTIAGVKFVDDRVGGGLTGPDCPTSPNGGCGGPGGGGGRFATTPGSDGEDGADGGPGNGSWPKSNVKTSPLAKVRVTTTKLPAARRKHAYSTTLKAKGGITPYRWKVAGLPKGLKLNAGSGKITGKARSTGRATLNVTVTDPTAAIPSTGKSKLTLTVKK